VRTLNHSQIIFGIKIKRGYKTLSLFFFIFNILIHRIIIPKVGGVKVHPEQRKDCGEDTPVSHKKLILALFNLNLIFIPKFDTDHPKCVRVRVHVTGFQCLDEIPLNLNLSIYIFTKFTGIIHYRTDTDPTMPHLCHN